MKHGWLLIMPVFLCFACSKKQTTSAVEPAIATVTVTNGYGSNTVALTNSGTTGSSTDSVYAWSNVPPAGMVFDKWTGDVASLKYPGEWKSKAGVTGRELRVTATYKMLPSAPLVNETINGSVVYYYVPAGYKGIILPFHGAGGNATGWLATNVENNNFVQYAVASGYAVVITESRDRTNKRWSTSPTNNPDINAINGILASLKQRNILPNQANLFGVGMSQGSGFCSLITYLNSYRAGALYCVPGLNAVFDQSTVPILWAMSRNDVTEEPTRLSDAYANYKKLSGRGIRAEFYINEPSPVYPERFTYIPGVDVATSNQIYNDLKQGGQLDAANFFTTNPRQSDAWKSTLSAPIASNKSLVNNIEDQLWVCYAEHKFHKDANARTIAFFDKSL